MYEVKDKIKSYSRERPIPVAIITGQEDLLRKEGFEDTLNCRLFRKNRDEEAVLEYIRTESEKLDDVRIKIDNCLAFEIFDEEVVKEIVDGSKIQSLKENLIKQLKEPVDIVQTPKIIRLFFEGLIIPLMIHYNAISKSYVKFNDQIRNINIDEKKFGKEIDRLFHLLGNNSQSLNHGKKEISVVNYLEERKDRYFLECHFQALLSILTWLPYFIRNHQLKKD